MENVSWYFTREQLMNSPSRKSGIDYNRELSYRQQAANFIQDMGQRLQVTQLCINTAIVYMHRYYSLHSFADVHRNNIAVAALFLAAKVEEQPRKIEHVLKTAHTCLHKDAPHALDVRTEAYSERLNEIVFHENLLLQTLGFVLAIEHPHTYVVKVCQLVKASKDLAQTSYIMATTSLHMTTMCMMYKPTVVACVCIHLACKWSSYMIEPCSEGKDWFFYVDKSVTKELLEKLTQEYISILERSPHRFKKKFAKDAASGYHGPSSITIDESSLPNRPSTSSEDSSNNKESSSPCNYDFGADFEEKRAAESPSTSHHRSHTQSSQPHEEVRRAKVEPPLAVKMEPPKPKHRPPPPQEPSSSSSNHVPPSTSSKYPTPVKVEVAQESTAAPVVSKPPPSEPQYKPKVKKEEQQRLPPPLPPSLPPLPHVRLSPIRDIKTNGAREETTPRPPPERDTRQKTPEGSKHHEKREKHKRHSSSHSSSSSKDRSVVTNHSAGIKVKIRKDVINLSDPKMPLKIKLPKPPMPEPPPAATPPPPPPPTPSVPSLKLVLTKDKSGSGSYSASQNKHDRKRSHPDSSSASGHKNSHEGPPPSKYHRSADHGGTPKTHHNDGSGKPPKVHSRHRSNDVPNSSSSRADATFRQPQQNYGNPGSGYQNQNYHHYQMTPPPPPPKLRGGHHFPPGGDSTYPPLPPPLPSPPPPPME